MADALVSFMLEKLATVTLDYIQQEVSLVVGAEEDVKKLTTTFKLMQAVLNDAELRQIKDETVKLWLEEFKDIAYDMDDVLDEWSYEMHKSQNDTGEEGNNNMKKKKVTSSSSSSYLCSLFSCFSKVALRHNIGSKIKDIKQRLDLAESEKHKYRLIKIKSDEKPIMRLKSSSLIDVSDIVGRVPDTQTIINKLMFLGDQTSTSTTTTQPESSSSTQALQLQAPNIISIVGMGGLGKTTLAQRVFNDDQVQTHFEKTMWVCVSDPFDLVTVTKSIIEKAKCEVPNSSEWNDTLHRSLIESIKGKRFLLVLDDVWTDDPVMWEPLENSLRNGAKGSRILVTTRNQRVALMMNATYTHSLGVLSDNDCALLLNRKALAGRRNEENLEELKKIGEEISKKCKGLPLAAKILGGLLHVNKNKKEWLRILESEIWKLEKVENGFLKPALLLSYYDLPLPLKGCFVYCSIFPKDYTIEKDLLVKLWMAQGFVKSKSGNEDLEEIADDYFNNLAMRSYFQDFNKDDNGNIFSCKMHDLVHDLAQYLTKNECSVKHTNDTQFLNSSNRVRHLSLVCEKVVGNSTDCNDQFTLPVCNAKKLRTLQILNEGELTIKEAPADLFHRFRCLKVLCLKRSGLENLSDEIENLIHLRYLDLSRNSNLKILPETISNLYNLQTLKLKGCRSLCKLPREMWRMINLRHLDLRETDELSHISQGIGRLTSLRTLTDFIVGGAAEGCKISELKGLNDLQGELSIRGLGRVETVNEALEMDLIKQKPLHTLRLNFEPNEEEEENGLLPKRMEDVLDVLEPHPDVVELELTDYLGFKLSRWMDNTLILSYMKTLELDVRETNELTHIGCEFLYEVDEASGEVRFNNNTTASFPKLEYLTMWTNELEWEFGGIIAGSGGGEIIMPCLRRVEISGFKNLKLLEVTSKMSSSLKFLKVSGEATEFIKYIRHGDDGREIILFPSLEELSLCQMEEMEELKIGFQVMPLLNCLKIQNCNKLKAIQGSFSKLETLVVDGGCASLYELGIPNLKSLRIWKSPIHPSLPEAFGTTLQALEVLYIDCRNNTLMSIPEQVQQLTSLKRLILWMCGDELVQRCRKDEGEDWRIISHIPEIQINLKLVTSCN